MIKSIVSFPKDSSLFINKPRNQKSERLITYYELYKLIKHLNGCILKCGINSDEAFGYFSFFKDMNQYKQQPMVAFEKSHSVFEQSVIDEETVLAVKEISKKLTTTNKNLIKKGIENNIQYIPGQLNISIPNYLIKNPELKIALLTIDLDDYETTLTAMQYLYPRLVTGGILIINNYYKKSAENLAIQEYFDGKDIIIRHFSLEKGPHYLIKD